MPDVSGVPDRARVPAELREHRGRTLTLIDSAEAAGHIHVAQMNQQVLTNLDWMIGEVEVEDPDQKDGAADAG